jgi:hypothetical protein
MVESRKTSLSKTNRPEDSLLTRPEEGALVKIPSRRLRSKIHSCEGGNMTLEKMACSSCPKQKPQDQMLTSGQGCLFLSANHL